MTRCGKYIGDNDAPCAPCAQLTCIRDAGHGGPCDNTVDDCSFARTYVHMARVSEKRALDHLYVLETAEIPIARGLVDNAAREALRAKIDWIVVLMTVLEAP